MQDETPPSALIYRLATAHYASHALSVAAELAVADHLHAGPLDIGSLAAKCESHAPSLRRVLRLLVAHGVFTEDEEGRFANTAVGDALRSGLSRAPARLFCGPAVRATWGDLLETVRTGEPAMHRAFGVGPFEYFQARPDEAAVFDEAMSSFTQMIARVVASHYPFEELGSVIDLGGGDGALLAGLLEAHPNLEGAVFDLPRLEASAQRRIAARGLAARLRFIGGDFFESVPEGFDAYLLKHVIHDWDDERATTILTRVRDAIGPEQRLLLLEGLYPERVDTSLDSIGATKNDCNMLVATGGRQRSAAEFRALFEASGFELTNVIRTPATTLVEGSPA